MAELKLFECQAYLITQQVPIRHHFGTKCRKSGVKSLWREAGQRAVTLRLRSVPHRSCAPKPIGHTQATRFTLILMDHTIERVVDLLDPSLNRIYNMTVEEARQRVLAGKPEAVRDIDGSFALLPREDKTIRMARSLDRPMR